MDDDLNFKLDSFGYSGAETLQEPGYKKIIRKFNFSNFKIVRQNQGIIITFIIFILNLINNTDRYVVSSVLTDIQSYYDINKSTAGLLQTIFLLTYMAFSPINGYLGDRINRKYLLITGILIWLVSTIGGSFVPRGHFTLFVLSRILFGVATASFEIIAVPLLGDVFKANQKHRDIGLMLHNLGAPLGVGFSYLIGLIAKDLEPDDWRFTMRFTPFLLAFMLILILLVYREPEREISRLKFTESVVSSFSEHSDKNTGQNCNNSGFISDLKFLFKNKTYILYVIFLTCSLSSLGAFNWWSSSFIDSSLRCSNLKSEKIDIFKKTYSILQASGGAIGLFIPFKISNYYKTKKGIASIDCYLFAFGSFMTTFFLYVFLITTGINPYLSICLYTLTIMFFNSCWLPIANILLDVLTPNLRATGNAFAICFLHLVGDDISPYWVGLIAEKCIKSSNQNENLFSSLLYCSQLSYYPLIFVTFTAGAIGLFTTLTFDTDKKNADDRRL